jgi:hypothetical protein
MGWSGWFEAKDLTADWDGYTTLADICERGKLTNKQARCVLMYARGFGWAEMAKLLPLPNRKEAWRYFNRAAKKIARSRPELFDVRRDWAKRLLWCFRNRLSTKPSGVATYDENGRRVGAPATMVIEDDLIQCPQALLEALDLEMAAA